MVGLPNFCARTQVFVAISLILGDGLYNLIKIILITTREICNSRSKQVFVPDVTIPQSRLSGFFVISYVWWSMHSSLLFFCLL